MERILSRIEHVSLLVQASIGIEAGEVRERIYRSSVLVLFDRTGMDDGGVLKSGVIIVG